MATISNVSAEQLAKLFHQYREALARDINHEKSAEVLSWDFMSREERHLMIAAAELALLDLEVPEPTEPRRKYYAVPGTAEWGC